MSGPQAATLSAPTQLAHAVHHIAIQTNDLDNAASWYEAFLGCRRAWTLASFSPLTQSRLPGIRRLSELLVGDIRLHLFERDGRGASAPLESVTQFQHIGVRVDDAAALAALRARWIELYECGRFAFAFGEQPTEIVTDSDGVQSFYAYDVNGLEFEFTYIPERSGR